MFKIIKESFRITNANIIIATPLIFFSIISSLYLIFSSGGNKIGLIFSAVLFFLMFGAFLSGWFYMIMQAVRNTDTESGVSITEFPSGVGEYFLSVLGMVFNVFVISTIIAVCAVFAGKKFIGGFGVPLTQMSQALSSIETMKQLVSSLSQEQLIKINAWNMLLFFAMVINYFVLMLYPAVVFFKEKNPFKAFFVTLKDTFGHRFFKNAGLFILTTILYTIISAISALIGSNIFVHFILTLINFYYITFVGILVFNYYYSNFMKIGSNVDTTV